MSVATLDGIAAKIHRADEHIEYFDAEIARVLSENYRIATKFHSDSREYRFSAFGEAVAPLRLAVIVGEIAHQLRSALDHVVTQLHAVGPGGGDPAKLEFPICLNPKRFASARKRGKITGVSESAAAAIEDLQPYRTSTPPEHAALYVLHNLDRTDKHRVLHVVVACVQMAHTLKIDAKQDIHIERMSPPLPLGVRPSKDGTEIFTVTFGEKFDPDVNMEADFTFQVTLDKLGTLEHLPALPTLRQMRQVVVDNIRSQFFPDLSL